MAKFPTIEEFVQQVKERVLAECLIDGEPLGELIDSGDLVHVCRCKECKHRPHKTKDGYTRSPRVQVGVYAWGEPEYEDDMACPYICDDSWYNRIPSDEQYCDMAERKEPERKCS